MNIQIRQIGSSASETVIRGHQVRIDRPTDKGGADDGPMGGELFLAAIGGCFMSNLLAAIKARQAKVSVVQTEVTATPSGSPPRFTEVELCVSGECADRQLFEKLVDIAERGCIMMNMLRGKLDLQVRIDTRV
jgi:putative redox protein